MIELGYRFCEMDKTHEYSVVSPGEYKYFDQWIWHWLKFRHTKNVRLMPYHSNWDSKMTILARYKGANAKIVASHISKKIEQHRKRTANIQKKMFV